MGESKPNPFSANAQQRVGANAVNNIIDNNLQVNNKNQADYIDKIIELQVYYKQGKFSESISLIQQYILKLDIDPQASHTSLVDSEMITLLNELLVLAFLKLKEPKNAKQISHECIQKLEKRAMFGFSYDAEVPFALKFMSVCALYSESNSKNKTKVLIELYRLQRFYGDFNSGQLLDVENQEGASNPYENKLKFIQDQLQSLFGLFPRKDDKKAKYIMICLEIFRVLHRAMDYRNAYNVLVKLNEKCPNNPMIISRLGRFCLEIGKKIEAISHF